jgi:hypothetical protein
MLYTYVLDVPANTPVTAPVKQDITLETGVLSKVSVLIPSGHAGLAHLIILYGETQVIPREGDISGDDETFPFTECFEIAAPSETLTLMGWNEDDTYSHEFVVRFEVLPLWLAAPARYIVDLLENVFRMLRII